MHTVSLCLFCCGFVVVLRGFVYPYFRDGSVNGLLPDGAEPLPETMLTYHHWAPLTIAWRQFHKIYLSHRLLKLIWKLLICSLICSEFIRKTNIKGHHSDVIMSAMASQISGVSIVCLTVCSGADQRKHQLCVTGLCEGNPPMTTTISHTKGQWRGKCFHLMTSSW